MNKMFKDLIRNIMEIYSDDMCVKSKKKKSHFEHMTRVFATLRKFRTKLNPAKCTFGVSFRHFLGNVVSKRGTEPHLMQIENLMKEQEPRMINDVQSFISKIMALNRFISRVSKKCSPFYKAIKGTKEVDWGEDQKKALEYIREYLNTIIELSIPEQGEELYVYLGQSESAISRVLFREENGKHKPVFYISRIMEDTERRYGPLEWLVLSLLNVSRKLKHYFEAHPIVIFTYQPLKSILSKPDITG